MNARTGLVDGYRNEPPSGYDEMLRGDGALRPAWAELAGALDVLGNDGLRARHAEATRLLDGDGVVYRSADAPGTSGWDLDPLPLVLLDSEWAALEPALAQRARLLDLLVTDLYGKRSVLSSGLLPPEIVFAHEGFLRDCDRIRVPGQHQLFFVASDLARDSDGNWVVVHDRAQSPSGAGFAMENRRVTSKVLPGLYRDARIHRLGPFFHAMRLGLEEVAPTTAEAPRIVLLTSGPMSETAYDQAFLSTLLGYPLAAGTDLFVREGRVWLRGIDGPEQVDVVLRRVDSLFCDPLDLRPDSQLGVPGLLEASRLGNVSVVNGLGLGVLENPGLLPFLPALAEVLLGEPLMLSSARTWWCGDPDGRRYVMQHLPELVLKPLSRGITRSTRFGWELTAPQRATMLGLIAAEPWNWVGQESVLGSTVPTYTGRSPAIEPRNMLLRTFAVAQGGRYHLLPGGLVRVAPKRDSVLVSSQTGALSKDAWVLTSRPQPQAEPWVLGEGGAELRPAAVAPRVAEDLFWLARYAERAECTTRLLRAVRERAADFLSSAEPAGRQAISVLLEVLTTVTTTWPGFVGEGGAELRQAPQAELAALVVDSDRPGTLAHSFARLVELSQAVRDQLSPDTFLVLGAFDSARRDLEVVVRPSEAALGRALNAAMSGLLAFSGLTAESMVRDLAWVFLELGRRVERAQQVAALLVATLVVERPPEVDSLVVESTLVAADSIITYRRRYAPRADVGTVLDLLLTDRDNPRSLAHQLDRVTDLLGQLPNTDPLRHKLSGLAASLRTADTTALGQAATDAKRLDMLDFLGDLQYRLRDLSWAVEKAYFEQPLAPQPLGPLL